MTFKKMTGKLHLWLGLASGLVVFIVSITGCILVFEDEIRDSTTPYLHVQETGATLLPPFRLAEIAEKARGKQASYITYNGLGYAVAINMRGAKKKSMAEVVYVNPYTGGILKVKNMKDDFFRFILKGHYYLWLPDKVGKIIVPAAVLLFLILLISGIVLWWPKHMRNLKTSLKIMWKARWRRVNYDLHNVLGFYAAIILFVIAATGLVFGYQWFARTLYFITSGGKEMVMTHKPFSGKPNDSTAVITDQMLANILQEKNYTSSTSITIYYPEKPKDAIMVYYNPDSYTHFRRDTRYFDRYSGKELHGKGSGLSNGLYKDASTGDVIKRMNYDLHVGAIFGLTGKILAFFASLIAASLPVTGFLVWWGRNHKVKYKPKI
jgi:uncharacterized iron-regulated membrane protein